MPLTEAPPGTILFPIPEQSRVVDMCQSTLLAVTVIALMAKPVHAEIFTWKDSRGSVHYVNNIYDVPEKYKARAKKINLGLPEKSDSTPSPVAQSATQAPSALPSPAASQPSAPPETTPAKTFQPVHAPPLPQSLLTSPEGRKTEKLQPGKSRRTSRSSRESDE